MEALGDAVAEGTETMQLVLSNLENATPGDVEGDGAILDGEVTLPQITVSDASDSEGRYARFEITLSQPVENDVRLRIRTRDRTAIAGEDYEPRSGVRIIPAGETRKTIYVKLLRDELQEPRERFALRVSVQSDNAVLGDDGVGVGTIVDIVPLADRARLTVSNAAAREGRYARFELSLSKPMEQDVKLAIRTRDRSATAGEDYAAVRGTRFIRAGETSKTIFVRLLEDELVEPNEHFALRVSFQSANVLPGDDGIGVGTILGDQVE